MAINNTNKPVRSDLNAISPKVGGTYGERRANSFPSNGQTCRPTKDFAFEPNAQYIRGNSVLPYKMLESGKQPKIKLSDQTRLAFLDRIIAGPAENKSPQSSKTPVKSTIKTVKA